MPKEKNSASFGDAIGRHGRARQFDHRPDQVRELHVVLLHRLLRRPRGSRSFCAFISDTMPTSGIMISGTIVFPSLAELAGGLHDGPRLHASNFRHGDP